MPRASRVSSLCFSIGPKLLERLQARVLRAHAELDVLLGFHLDVETDFRVQSAIELAVANQRVSVRLHMVSAYLSPECRHRIDAGGAQGRNRDTRSPTPMPAGTRRRSTIPDRAPTFRTTDLCTNRPSAIAADSPATSPAAIGVRFCPSTPATTWRRPRQEPFARQSPAFAGRLTRHHAVDADRGQHHCDAAARRRATRTTAVPAPAIDSVNRSSVVGADQRQRCIDLTSAGGAPSPRTRRASAVRAHHHLHPLGRGRCSTGR